ncbi:hypothetical protein RN001_001751 [Aquatica leii]|uniref:Trichohyalin-plectin-homology domain-containing protein n=1 Tax=Aquatica leii TaxID=1421715 RepID=A0AAN7SSP8_9COLE|nr:hypothetical protein RN001_001751 [Aquatica leii]
MFGKLDLPKPNTRVRPRPVPLDINFPMPQPGLYGHMARPPNTDYHYKIVQYKQRKEADFVQIVEEQKAQQAKDLFLITFDEHVERRRFRTELQKRLDLKMEEYEASIDKRRERLRELLAIEEREFYHETVDVAQRGNENRMDDMKKRSLELIAKRESERLEIVKEKRLQQYMDRCVDLRGVLTKKHLIESKNSNLQQMRENEAKREAEREIDRMWHELTLKEILTKKEKEEHEAIKKYEQNKLTKNVWDMQIKGKELLRQEIERVTLEDRRELEKINEQLNKEKIESLIKKRRVREECDKALRKQLETQHKLTEQRKKEENALDAAFVSLAQLEIERENAKKLNTSAIAKKELAQYHQNLIDLDELRKNEDRLFNELLEQYRKDIEHKQDEAKCKIAKARRKLQEEVIKGREEQIAYKKMIAEEELKMKQDDNQLTLYACEANNRLEAEMLRQEKIAKLQYKDDLIKQIEYQKIVQQREKDELERQLAVGRKEEERYQKLISDMCSGNILIKTKHPFRRLIETYDCHCPETTAKPQ